MPAPELAATVVIACPHCGTRYQVAYAAIGRKGRDVLCAHCGQSWQAHAEPPAAPAPPPPPPHLAVAAEAKDFGQLAEEMLDEKFLIEEQHHKFRHGAAAKAEAEARAARIKARKDAEATGLAWATERAPAAPEPRGEASPPGIGAEEPQPQDGEADAAESVWSEAQQETIEEIRRAVQPRPAAENLDPAVHRRRQQEFFKRQRTLHSRLPVARFRRMARLSALVAVLGFLGGGIVLRGPVVQQFPQLAGLYRAVGLGVNVVGLEFRDVQTLKSLQDGTEVLAVNGKIASVASHETPVPQVIVTLLAGDGSAVYEWSMTPKAAELEPGEMVAFETQLSRPPDTAMQVKLSFSNGRAVPRPTDTRVASSDAAAAPRPGPGAETIGNPAPAPGAGAAGGPINQLNDGKSTDGQNPAR
jgi:predicted Zn finger-like uncharacterized protein